VGRIANDAERVLALREGIERLAHDAAHQDDARLPLRGK
jgi:hypothetical protein